MFSNWCLFCCNNLLGGYLDNLIVFYSGDPLQLGILNLLRPRCCLILCRRLWAILARFQFEGQEQLEKQQLVVYWRELKEWLVRFEGGKRRLQEEQ